MVNDGDQREDNIQKLKKVFDQYVAIEKSYRSPKNIFSILDYKRDPNTTSREMSYQFALKYFLNPNEPHGFGNLVLRSLLNLVSERNSNLKNPSIDYVKVDKEVVIKKDTDNPSKRIDLVVANYKAPSKTDETPEWLILMELKVGASENKHQTRNYAEADVCYPNWVEESLNINEIDEKNCFYTYIKLSGSNSPAADKEKREVKRTGGDWHKFDSIDWSEIVKRFDDEVSTKILGKPHRSVVQFSDFMDSLKGEENMEGSTKDKEMKTLNDVLKLYLQNKELLDDGLQNLQAEIENQKENLCEKIRDDWTKVISDEYDIPQKESNDSNQGWVLNPGDDKWQRIQPDYWIQDVGKDKPLNISFLHLVDEDVIFQEDSKITLKFGFRLPAQRGAHTEKNDNETSFNKLFQDEAEDKLSSCLSEIDGIDTNFGSANEIFWKVYSRDIDEEQNIFDVYMEMLKGAIHEFCIENAELSTKLNEIFDKVFREVYSDTQLEGSFPSSLNK